MNPCKEPILSNCLSHLLLLLPTNTLPNLSKFLQLSPTPFNHSQESAQAESVAGIKRRSGRQIKTHCSTLLPLSVLF